VSGAGDYAPIQDYGLIGDCRTAALVSRGGSIDWWCVPRFDSGSCFGRLLDHERGGHCSIVPADEGATAFQRYVDHTLVLETIFRGPAGGACVLDCLALPDGGPDAEPVEPGPLLLRVIEGRRGVVELDVRIAPRFDYGDVQPQVRKVGPQMHHVLGGDDALAIGGELELEREGSHDLAGRVAVRGGERKRLYLRFCRPGALEEHGAPDLDAEAIDRLLDQTLHAWRAWSEGTFDLGTPEAEGVRRSALILKALTYAPTGAVVAAATTSLPETEGGERNWDYRYAWIRDSTFAARCLADLGHDVEADRFRRFIERSAAGHVGDLRIAYGVGGERRLIESEVDLEGYRGARPVRIGNGAAEQTQLDALGMLVDLTWRWHRRGHSPDDDHWRFVVDVVDRAAEAWKEPDRGLWEWRDEPKHFVHSKVMCWAAVDRGLRLAKECLRKAPERRWGRARDEIREAVEREGFDAERGVFVQAFGSKSADGALLLLPLVDFVAFDDPRMLATVDFVRDELSWNGLLRRYDGDDGLPGREGAFLACSFWLAECLAYQGRHQEAREAFDAALATASELGIFSEEHDPERDEAYGNVPQALTHLSHISAALALSGSPPDTAR
jgi:GH15 family glucan-1,4-alpha-glucosidase